MVSADVNICSTGFFHKQLEHFADLVPVLPPSIFALFHTDLREDLKSWLYVPPAAKITGITFEMGCEDEKL
jgi:hypothetical protein